MSRDLHQRLKLAEAEEIGRRFVRLMEEGDRHLYDRAPHRFRARLVELYDDAREWGGEHVVAGYTGERAPRRRAA